MGHHMRVDLREPRLVRWAAVEAASRNHDIEPIHDIHVRVGQRREVNNATGSACRYALRVGVWLGVCPVSRCTCPKTSTNN